MIARRRYSLQLPLLCLLAACSGEAPAPAQGDRGGSGASPAGGSPGVDVSVPEVTGGATSVPEVTGGATSVPVDPPGGSGGSPAVGGAGSGGAAGAAAGGAASAGGAGGATLPEGGATGRGTGPGDWGPGDYPPNLESPEFLEISGVAGQNGHVRHYKVHVPPSYQPDVPMPLVFCIHGLAQDALLFCVSGTEMPAKSDEAGFILVMPNGYSNSWNGGACCAAASNEQLDDVALFRAILEEVGTHVNVDLDRVYATGLSNGGFMSYRLACEAADIFAAIAPGAGAIGTNELAANWDLAAVGSLVGATNPSSDFTECTPSRPVPVLDVHGTADAIVSYSLQQPSLEIMAEVGGCSSSTGAAMDPPSGGDTTCVSYEGCDPGVEVTACSVDNGGHCWFGSPDCGTGGGDLGLAFVGANSDTMVNTDAIWDFFARHTLN